MLVTIFMVHRTATNNCRVGGENGFKNAVLVFSGGSSRRGCGVAARSFDGPDGDARYKLGSFDEEHGNDARRHGCRETIWQRRCGLRELDAAASPSCRRNGENGTSLWQRPPDASACAGNYYRPGIRNSVDAALAQPAEGPHKGSESTSGLRPTNGEIA